MPGSNKTKVPTPPKGGSKHAAPQSNGEAQRKTGRGSRGIPESKPSAPTVANGRGRGRGQLVIVRGRAASRGRGGGRSNQRTAEVPPIIHINPMIPEDTSTVSTIDEESTVSMHTALQSILSSYGPPSSDGGDLINHRPGVTVVALDDVEAGVLALPTRMTDRQPQHLALLRDGSRQLANDAFSVDVDGLSYVLLLPLSGFNKASGFRYPSIALRIFISFVLVGTAVWVGIDGPRDLLFRGKIFLGTILGLLLFTVRLCLGGHSRNVLLRFGKAVLRPGGDRDDVRHVGDTRLGVPYVPAYISTRCYDWHIHRPAWQRFFWLRALSWVFGPRAIGWFNARFLRSSDSRFGPLVGVVQGGQILYSETLRTLVTKRFGNHQADSSMSSLTAFASREIETNIPWWEPEIRSDSVSMAMFMHASRFDRGAHYSAVGSGDRGRVGDLELS